MRTQKFCYLTVERNEDTKHMILVDSAGAKFDVPQINDFGSKPYKRAVAAANSPDRFCIKARCKGNLSDGELTFGKFPASYMEDAEPVTNFDKPDGGLEQYRIGGDYTPQPKEEKSMEVQTGKVADDVLSFIHTDAVKLKPKNLFMKELKWKYLIRNIIRGKNIMMTGPAGCGKTMAAKAAAAAMDDYSTVIFNLGSTQDPRATLIGSTAFDAKTGTLFNESPFVTAISTPNTVVVLDELSRAHPEAHNILMPVLDEGQRYIRLDEAPNSPTVKVAKGVSFIASANIGNEYTATRQIDKALRDRFTVIEMDTLTVDEELELLKMMYSDVNEDDLKAVAEITSHTRDEVKKESPKLTNSLSTRTAVEIGSLLQDGFTLEEAAEITIYPEFEDVGGAENSERIYIRQFVQKFIKNDENDKLFDVDDAADPDDIDLTNPF